MSTTVVKYTSYQAKRYVTEYFPASVIWQYFAPPPSPTLEDTTDGGDSNDNVDYYNNRELKAEEFLLNLAQSADNGKYLREELRDWRFNKSYGNFTCDSAARFKELYLTKATGKYDAGAIRLLPLESLSSNPAISKQFVVDFDATDYQQLRTMCGCGYGKANKTKMCAKCSKVMGVAAKVTVDILEKAYGFKRVHCFFSGGRGIHVRVLDGRASCLSDKARKFIADTIMRAPQLGNEVTKLCQSFIDLGKDKEMMNLRFDSIIIDEGVSTAITKLTRGPFSIHDKTGYLCVPLANPLDFDIPMIGIHVTDLVNPASPNHEESKRRFQSALQLLQEWATVE